MTLSCDISDAIPGLNNPSEYWNSWMLINLFEDVDHFSLMGGKRSLRRLAVAKGRWSSEDFQPVVEYEIDHFIRRIKLLSSERAQVAMCLYVKFWIAGQTLFFYSSNGYFPDPPWNREQFDQIVESTAARFSVSPDRAREVVSVYQDCFNVLSNLPSSYPDHGRHPSQIAEATTSNLRWGGINTAIAELGHFVGYNGEPGVQVPEIMNYRIPADAFIPGLVDRFTQYETVWREASEEARAALRGSLASGEVITVESRTDLSEVLIGENEFTRVRPTEIMSFDKPSGGKIAWFDLHTDNCQVEGRVMSHCGDGDSSDDKAVLVSLREQRTVFIRNEQVVETFWEPKITASANLTTGAVYELRGRGNSKPKPEYHPYIIPMIESGKFREFEKPGYRPDHTFELKDLPKNIRFKLLEKTPTLVPAEDLLSDPDYTVNGKPLPWAITAVAEQVAKKSPAVEKAVAATADGGYAAIDVTLKFTFYDYLRKLDESDGTLYSAFRWTFTDDSFVSYNTPEITDQFADCILDRFGDFGFDFGSHTGDLQEVMKYVVKQSQRVPNTNNGVRVGRILSALTSEKEERRLSGVPYDIAAFIKGGGDKLIRSLYREFQTQIIQRAVFDSDKGTIEWFNKGLVLDLADMITPALYVGEVSNKDGALGSNVSVHIPLGNVMEIGNRRRDYYRYNKGLVSAISEFLANIDPVNGYDFDINKRTYPRSSQILARHWKGEKEPDDLENEMEVEEFHSQQITEMIKKFMRTAYTDEFYDIMNDAIVSAGLRPAASD